MKKYFLGGFFLFLGLIAANYFAYKYHQDMIFRFSERVEQAHSFQQVMDSASEIPFVSTYISEGFYLEEERVQIHDFVSIESTIPIWEIHCSVYADEHGYTTGYHACSAYFSFFR